jgi:hypothetical protein
MVVLPYTGALHYHDYGTGGGTSLKYFGYRLLSNYASIILIVAVALIIVTNHILQTIFMVCVGSATGFHQNLGTHLYDITSKKSVI